MQFEKDGVMSGHMVILELCARHHLVHLLDVWMMELSSLTLNNCWMVPVIYYE